MSRRLLFARTTVALIAAVVFGSSRPAASQADVVTVRAELIATAAALDAFWAAEFTARGLTYRPPRLVMEDGPLRSACAGETWFAAYCPIGMALHVDPADIAGRSGTYGPGLPALTLAHEWTHHVVTILYADRAWTTALAPILADVRVEELLADCQAGAFVAWTWARNAAEPDMVDGARAFLADNASDVHGDAAARTDAFDRGYDGGIIACGLFPPLPALQPGAPR